MLTLKERLKDWTDFDGVQYELAVVLGIYKDYRIEGGSWLDHSPKSVFWSQNILGNALSDMMSAMIRAEILEENGEGQFRQNIHHDNQMI